MRRTQSIRIAATLGSGRRRSPVRVRSLLFAAAALWAGSASAQLEVLLRGLQPAKPHAGACGLYRFSAEEPDGPRSLTFEVCVERIAPGRDGSVFLRLTSGDSLDARIEVAPELFRGTGGALADHIRSVVEIARGDTTRLARRDWAEAPGLARAPSLPSASDSSLGSRKLQVGGRELAAQGRHIHEESRQVRALGNAQMTQSEIRDIEIWTSPEAPILDLVQARATIVSERQLSAPVPGVPQRGPRRVRYDLELIGSPARARGAARR